ncbi:hypothetical protein ACVWWO_003725 [Bradyrhizobium sp. F1.13.1]
MPDLNIAMSLHPSLLSMVQHLTNHSLSDAASFRSQVKQILYHWAGVENVDPNSRGSYVNAQDHGQCRSPWPVYGANPVRYFE